MSIDVTSAGRARRFMPVLAVLALAGCAAPPAPRAPVQPPPAATVAVPAPVSAPAPQPAAPPPPPPATARVTPADLVLAYADRVRALPPGEVTQEIQRLGDSAYSPVRALQLVLALAQSHGPAPAARAQALLQRVLAQQDGEAPQLHPLARLIAAQLADQRRSDEQADRQQQQLREAQRRIEQLNDRLEAVRAIERSVPTVPRREPRESTRNAPSRPAP
jgi:hypothetical protein